MRTSHKAKDAAAEKQSYVCDTFTGHGRPPRYRDRTRGRGSAPDGPVQPSRRASTLSSAVTGATESRPGTVLRAAETAGPGTATTTTPAPLASPPPRPSAVTSWPALRHSAARPPPGSPSRRQWPPPANGAPPAPDEVQTATMAGRVGPGVRAVDVHDGGFAEPTRASASFLNGTTTGEEKASEAQNRRRNRTLGAARQALQAARRRTSQTVAAMSSADSASSQPPSIHWNGQNRLAGW